MPRKWIGIVGALAALIFAAIVSPAAQATSGLVAQTSLPLAPGVTFTTYLDSTSRTVIDVTRISAGARVLIKAVPASPDGRGAKALPTTLCQQVKAVACVNGDFFDPAGDPVGGEMVDGRWLKSPTAIEQQLWIDGANQFSIGEPPTDAVQSLGATKYPLPLPGHPISIPEPDAFARGRYARTMIGWNSAGDRLLVTVDHGHGSPGMSLTDAAGVMAQLGATTAVNEDGGGSAQMVLGGPSPHVVGSTPRPVANIWAVVALPAGTDQAAVSKRSPSRPARTAVVPPRSQWSITPRP